MRRTLIAAAWLAASITPIEHGLAQQRDASKGKTVVVAGVADARTGAPVVGADVTLPALNRSGRADWIGEVRISNVPRGSQVVAVRALGYASSSIVLPVEGDSVGAVFMLEPDPASMDTVRVTAAATPTYLREFAMRRRVGFGQFLTDSALSKEPDRGLATVLTSHLHGLLLAGEPGETGSFLTVVAAGVAVGDGGSTSAGLGQCPVDIYVDGHKLIDHLESIATRSVAGVELYDFESAPPQYRAATPLGRTRQPTPCKLLLIWTKQY